MAAYLEGELTAAQQEDVEAEIASSEESRARLDELRQLRARLAAPLAEEEGFDLTLAVRRALDKPPTASSWPIPASPRRGRVAGYLAAFAACAALALAAYGRNDPLAREFRAKAVHSGSPGERWSGIHVFRVPEAEAPQPLEERLSRREGVLFTYRNAGARPYRYLMIFARDAAGEVRWFYPAYEQAGSDPRSVPIAASSAETLLPEVIHHTPATGPLTFYGLFTRRALRTSEVEAWLTTQPGRPWASLAPEGRMQELAATVVP